MTCYVLPSILLIGFARIFVQAKSLNTARQPRGSPVRFITLNEIDPDSNAMLVGFKKWADEEFGGVKSAFAVLDEDQSGGLTFREFKRAVGLLDLEKGITQ